MNEQFKWGLPDVAPTAYPNIKRDKFHIIDHVKMIFYTIKYRINNLGYNHQKLSLSLRILLEDKCKWMNKIWASKSFNIEGKYKCFASQIRIQIIFNRHFIW